MTNDKIGLWLIGARGGVAATALLGLEWLKRRQLNGWGLVSNTPSFAAVPLLDWSQVVVGGHEIRSTTLVEAARQLAESSRAFDPRLVHDCQSELEQIEARIRPGVVRGCGNAIANLADASHVRDVATPRAAIDLVQSDLKDFIEREQVKRVVMINVASTEPRPKMAEWPDRWSDWDSMLSDEQTTIPASALYAIAAIELGQAYVNFTPSIGSDCAAIRELAMSTGACHAGRDGKTGETWLKSVLAPAFAARNLEVMSWVGHNIFGNLDGRILDDPLNKASKVSSKDHLLGEILGYTPQTHVSIEYIRSLGDWKTAWDHIHFRGFLGTPMILQFTWQGCDSILAAPMVLDLLRFTELALRRGERGELTCLSPFFKSPQGARSHEFAMQMQELVRWANSNGA